MAVVVKWKSDGEYLRGFTAPENGRGLHWTSHRRCAMRFESQAEAKRRVRKHLGSFPYTSAEVAFVRLVPKRRAEASPLASLSSPSEPTARDAVAGMLLRYGLRRSAWDLASGSVLADVIREVAQYRQSHAPAICLQALESLARGNLRGARGHQDLFAAIERLTRERDEARAEAVAAGKDGPFIPHEQVMTGVCERAHANGVVEGLSRARRIVRAHCQGPLQREVDEEIATWIEKASASGVPADRQPHVDRAALLALAERWETEAKRLDGYASPGADGLEDYGEGKGLARASADIRRLLDAPRGPGVGERESVGTRAAQDAAEAP